MPRNRDSERQSFFCLQAAACRLNSSTMCQSPAACSGGMYSGVPSAHPARDNPSPSSARATVSTFSVASDGAVYHSDTGIQLT
jgi:hypothetical protein